MLELLLCDVRYQLFLSGCRGRLGACKEGVGGCDRGWSRVICWQRTKLIYWKISSVSIQQRSGGAGCTVLGYKAPSGNVKRWPAAGLPLDRLLIKVLTRSGFILSWKVSKGASPVMH